MSEADLEQLYARLRKPVYNVVYRWTWNADEAQDVVQEAFVRLWRMRGRVRPATAEPLLYKIALNLASSRRRRRRLWRWLPLEPFEDLRVQAGPDVSVTRNEEHGRLRAAVLSLPEELRRVVMLCEFSDLTQTEIADILSIPAGTVGSRRHRALRMLRERLSVETAGDDE